MSPETRTPRTAHGTDAVAAVLDDLELSERLDTTDTPELHERFYDLTRIDERLGDRTRRAAEVDWLTPDEAMADLAAEIGRESPYEDDRDAYEH